MNYQKSHCVCNLIASLYQKITALDHACFVAGAVHRTRPIVMVPLSPFHIRRHVPFVVNDCKLDRRVRQVSASKPQSVNDRKWLGAESLCTLSARTDYSEQLIGHVAFIR